MRQRMIGRARRGLSMLEVVVALTILGMSLLGMAEYGRRYSRANANSSMLNQGIDLASARVERVKAERNYATMDTLAGMENVIAGYPTFKRQTIVQRTLSTQFDYKTVTVIVTHPALKTPVRKTSAVSRF